MTRYETSPEVRPLEKTICEFAGLNGYTFAVGFKEFMYIAGIFIINLKNNRIK